MEFFLSFFICIGLIGQKGECISQPYVVGPPGIKGDQGFPGAPGNKIYVDDYNTLFF